MTLEEKLSVLDTAIERGIIKLDARQGRDPEQVRKALRYAIMSDSEFLRSLAQNDHMIDGHFLPTGERLNAIAEALDT